MKKSIISVLMLTAAAFAQENYSTAWSGHTNVIINTQAIAVTTHQIHFPVLIRLGAADSAIFSQAKAGGVDLRFTKGDNATRLPHLIESWNATAKTAAVWVLADTLYGTRNNNLVRMHWGNSAAADSSNGAAVFKTANGFQAVWKFNSASGNDTDVTANKFVATPAPLAAPSSAAGQIGGARAFGGAEYFTVPGSASGPLNFAFNGNYSISAWVNIGALTTHSTILSKHDRDYALKLNNAGNLEFFEFADASGWNAVSGTAEAGTWVHVVGVQNGAEPALYINGVRADQGMVPSSSTSARLETFNLAIGAEPTSDTTFRRFFTGSVDELRMASASRSADWVKLEYETQKAGQTTVKLLDTVPASVSRAAFTARNNLTVRSAGNGLQFRVAGAGAVKARVAVMDMWGRTVWTRLADLQANTVTWDGRASNGQLAPQGVYAVRITLLNAQGRTTQVLEKKVPFTR